MLDESTHYFLSQIRDSASPTHAPSSRAYGQEAGILFRASRFAARRPRRRSAFRIPKTGSGQRQRREEGGTDSESHHRHRAGLFRGHGAGIGRSSSAALFDVRPPHERRQRSRGTGTPASHSLAPNHANTPSSGYDAGKYGFWSWRPTG